MNFVPDSIPTTQLYDEELARAGVQLFVKRLDLIHPVISGNKWFKLKYNLEKAKHESKKSLLTFGGAYSNHIAATAAAANSAGIKVTGIIRGEKPEILNPVLEYSLQQGMDLVFVSREEYKIKNEAAFLKKIKEEYNDPYIIPEGGANAQGVKGCTEILEDDEKTFDYIFCACGTATTLSGIILSCNNSATNIIGISVLKGAFSLDQNVYRNISPFQETYKNWKIIHEYHFGGYAKSTNELDLFIKDFIKNHNIYIESVYTGKTFFAVYDLIKRKKIKNESKILVVHTGGFNQKLQSSL